MTVIVYAHYRPGAPGGCFYIGKGSVARSRSKAGRNAGWRQVVESAGGFDARIVALLKSDAEALEHEAEVIALLRDMGANLVNVHAGGSMGAVGIRFSEEHRRKIGDAHRGKKLSLEQCKRIGDAHRGKSISEAQKAIAAATCRARNSTPEQIAKVQAFLTGRPRTPEERKTMSDAQLRRFAERGAPPQSEETKRKRAESVRISWIARRASSGGSAN